MSNIKENLEFIRQKCVSANPSLLKLEFGCRIHMKDTIEEAYYLVTNYYPQLKEVRVVGGRCIEEKNIGVILGKEPTLSDVLLAIKDNLAEDRIPAIDLTNFTGGISKIRIENRDGRAYWELDKDLREQSEPTLAFLRSLLEQ